MKKNTASKLTTLKRIRWIRVLMVAALIVIIYMIGVGVRQSYLMGDVHQVVLVDAVYPDYGKKETYALVKMRNASPHTKRVVGALTIDGPDGREVEFEGVLPPNKTIPETGEILLRVKIPGEQWPLGIKIKEVENLD